MPSSGSRRSRVLRPALRAEPELVPSAVEGAPAARRVCQAMPRWASEDTEIHGRPIAKGEMVMLLWASANRDPEHFAEPDACVSIALRTTI